MMKTDIMKNNWWSLIIKCILIVVLFLLNPVTTKSAKAALAQGDAITDPEAILRYALPIDNKVIREIQRDIEQVEKEARRKRWSLVAKKVKNASFLLKNRKDEILASVPEEKRARGEELLAAITEKVGKLEEAVAAEDKEEILQLRDNILDNITELEESMVKGFPFKVPEEYSHLPQLLGRAKVEIKTTKGDMIVVVDGYSAPVTAGNFVDLVKRKFYDGLPFIRVEDRFVVQTGDPEGPEEGFIDPKTGKYRAIPLEILLKGESEPLYGFTTEDVGKPLAQPVLPFSAYGAVALARPSTDPNGGSSQFFFFKFDNELTPPGYNLMDGRFAVFGYVVEGAEVLEEITPEDKIISARVIEGEENLVEPAV